MFILASLLAAGALYEWFGEARDDRRYPAPGKVMELASGAALHVWTQGEHGATVVFEAGIAGSSLGWTLVQPAAARFARSVSYDRAGLGWSGGRLTQRTLENMIGELAAVLRLSGAPPPYVLVGHSFGGLLIRAFAHAYPAETQGLVMVDPVTLAGWAEAGPDQLRRIQLGASLARRGAWLARFGLVRGALATLISGGRWFPKLVARATAGQGTSVMERLVSEVRKLPAEAQPMVGAHWSRPRAFRAMANYLEALPACARQALTMAIPASVPCIVLSAASATRAELAERDSWTAGNGKSRHVQVPGTSHWLQLERMDLVIEAIRELI